MRPLTGPRPAPAAATGVLSGGLGLLFVQSAQHPLRDREFLTLGVHLSQLLGTSRPKPRTPIRRVRRFALQPPALDHSCQHL